MEFCSKLWTYFATIGRSSKCVINLAQSVINWTVVARRSTKLTIPPSSDSRPLSRWSLSSVYSSIPSRAFISDNWCLLILVAMNKLWLQIRKYASSNRAIRDLSLDTSSCSRRTRLILVYYLINQKKLVNVVSFFALYLFHPRSVILQ